MVHLGADADPLAQFVVVVAGHVGHELLAVFEAQRVQKLRPSPTSLGCASGKIQPPTEELSCLILFLN